MSTTQLTSRLVRYGDLKPCLNAFVDTRTPGSDKKENFSIIGPGVSENPDQHVHIPEPHGFNIGGARQPPGCLNSQHSHETAEVFIVHSGHWRFTYGVNADDAHVDLAPGDTISIPTHMFRGFANTGDDVGFLFAVLGGDDPGKVVWAPSVFELAKQYGLVLLEGGRLVDVAGGETLPDDARRQQPPDAAKLAELSTPDSEKLAVCVATVADLRANPDSALMEFAIDSGVETGVCEAAVITPVQTDDGFAPGPIQGWWSHGFNVRQLSLQTGCGLADHTRAEAEVVFLQSGTVHIIDSSDPANRVTLHAGDTLTLPVGFMRRWENSGSGTAVAYIVRGSDSPEKPTTRTQ